MQFNCRPKISQSNSNFPLRDFTLWAKCFFPSQMLQRKQHGDDLQIIIAHGDIAYLQLNLCIYKLKYIVRLSDFKLKMRISSGYLIDIYSIQSTFFSKEHPSRALKSLTEYLIYT